MTSLRVGLVSPYDLSVPGGVQAQVLGLARYLEGAGDRPLVIGPGLPEGVQGVDLGRSVSVPANGSRVPISIDPRVRSLIREGVEGLDLIHVHEPLMPMASLLATRAGPPVLATFHAAPGGGARLAYRLAAPMMRWLLGRTRAITAVSRTAASALPSGLEARIIPNGLDISVLQVDVERDPARISFLGRDEPRKGLDVLLSAWPRVRSTVAGSSLTVMGANRGIGDATWLGRVDDETKARVLASSAVFVAPQLGGESFGIVLLEAMAAGAAVVASDLEAFVELADGSARFFATGNHASLADVLIDLLGDPVERDRLAEAGRDLAGRHDWARVGPEYRSLYVEIAA